VLIKRAMSGTLDELLQSAEYVFSSGNERLNLCERGGCAASEPSYRNMLDLERRAGAQREIAPAGAGRSLARRRCAALGRAPGAGRHRRRADGLLYEVHERPHAAVSDAAQTLDFQESSTLIRRAQALYVSAGKSWGLRRQSGKGKLKTPAGAAARPAPPCKPHFFEAGWSAGGADTLIRGRGTSACESARGRAAAEDFRARLAAVRKRGEERHVRTGCRQGA
jgi:hypothetical protein